jgi:hypothetical protein
VLVELPVSFAAPLFEYAYKFGSANGLTDEVHHADFVAVLSVFDRGVGGNRDDVRSVFLLF